jgi:hypothetical protein
MLFKESLPSKFNPNQATQFVPVRPSSSAPSPSDTILHPPPSTLALWTRIIEHPETLTPSDREIILSRHPLASTNALYQAKCGLTLPELQDKAIDHPETLTQLECALLRTGPRDPSRGQWDDPKNILRWPRDLKLLRLGAVEIALEPRDRIAEKRAVKRIEGIQERIFQARARLDPGRDVLNLKKAASGVEWAEGVVGRAEGVEWGFVGFRTGFGDEAGWERWKGNLAEGTEEAVWLGRLPERLEGRWRVVWVEERELEGAGLEALCE